MSKGASQTAVPQELDYVLRRGVAEIITEDGLRELLACGRPLRLKYGVDPSRPDLHLGHAVGLRKLRQFQELGHQVVLIIGDWTAQIGDPSMESASRPMLSADEVRANAETYLRQFFKVVDRERTRVAWQSEWFGRFDLGDVIRLAGRFTVAQMLARADFAERYAAGRPLSISEMLYPLLQAYDSVAIEADVEFGGTDQKFNLLVGRELQSMVGQPPQQLLMMPILVGTDGQRKMSKSLGNYIAFEDHPHDMYGKLMSIPDTLILDYLELVTDVPDEEIEGYRRLMQERAVNPMEVKQRLAREVVADFHGLDASQEAEENFRRVVQKRQLPAEVPEVRLSFDRVRLPGQDEVDITEVMLVAGLVKSRGEAKRLLAQSAVEVDGYVPSTNAVSIHDGSIVRVGRRRFVRLVNTDPFSG